MAYFNQAGTSWPKPPPVLRAVQQALAAPVETWAERFEAHHAAVARAFGVTGPDRLLPTPGATTALGVGIADHPWARGDRILTSGLEHHALSRPVQKLADLGVEVGIVPPGDGRPMAPGALEEELRRGGVRMVALTAASNVTGDLLPVDEAIHLAHRYDALVLVDASQVAGWLPLDVEAMDVDLLAFTGHKGPQGPWGIGGLVMADRVVMASPAAACELPATPGAVCAPKPGYCDVGSVDRAAMAGLVAGLAWLEDPSRGDRLARARGQAATVDRFLAGREGVTRHAFTPVESRMPVVAFTVADTPVASIVAALAERGMIVAGGLQCAPQAHETLGTAPEGVVRVSFGPGNAPGEEDALVEALAELLP